MQVQNGPLNELNEELGAYLQRLSVFDVTNNKLTKFPKSFSNVSYLTLSNNKLKDEEFFIEE